MKTHKTSYFVLTVALIICVSVFLSPVFSQSTNPCGSCHGGYYQYLDILEGNSGNSLPTTLKVGQTSTVTVVVENRVNTARYTDLSGVSLTLTSQNGHFSVATPTYNVGTLPKGTATATWQITGVSAGADALVIAASGRNSHQSLSFSDSYSPSTSIDVQAAPPPPPATYTVTVELSPNGTTMPTSGIYNYTSGSSVTFTATPKSGYKFDNWKINGANDMTNPITIPITSNLVITPVFTLLPPPPPPLPTTYTVTVQSSPNGTTTPVPGTYNQTSGGSLTFTGTPNAGYKFNYWLVNGVTNATNPMTLTVASNVAVNPVFTLQGQPPPPPPTMFIVTVQSSPNGTTSPTSGTYNFTLGASVIFNANPNANYKFDSWLVNGVANTTNPMTIMVTSNLDVTPVFTLQPPTPPVTFTVTVQLSPNGTTVPSSGVYNYTSGSSVTFAANPNAGYNFTYWLIDGIVNTTNPITKTIDSNFAVSPVFTLQAEPALQENQTSTPTGNLTITILTPANGEKWRPGTTHTVVWRASGGTNPLNVTLEFTSSKSGQKWVATAENVTNNGSFTWRIPMALETWLIRATVTDASITPQIATVSVEVEFIPVAQEFSPLLGLAMMLPFAAVVSFFFKWQSVKTNRLNASTSVPVKKVAKRMKT